MFEHTLGGLHIIKSPSAINLWSKAQFKNKIFQTRIDLHISDLIELHWKIQVSEISEKDFRIMNKSYLILTRNLKYEHLWAVLANKQEKPAFKSAPKVVLTLYKGTAGSLELAEKGKVVKN